MATTERVREKAWVAMALALVGGCVDAVGYITLLGVFIAHMSGNSAAMGAHFGQGKTAAGLARAAPIPLFVIGVGGGAMLIEVLARRGVRSTAAVVLGLEATLLFAVMLLGDASLTHGVVAAQKGWTFYGLIVLAATAMGLQTSALRRLAGQTVRTTFVTGMLTHLGEEAAKFVLPSSRPSASASRLRLLALVWLCYAAGAIFGGWAHDQWALNALVAPLVVLVALIGVDLIRPIHGV
ncbi:MAG TPA: YoaK family protein [Acidimicrobiales bacterium]|nr:YoaK family protein [Acidimicrobiales bacterium]